MKDNPHGGNGNVRLDFSASVNPLGTPEGAKKAAKAAIDSSHIYPDPCCRELISALASHEGVPEDDILCGTGAAELIYAYASALRPKTALEAAPTFSEYAEALEICGLNMERYFLRRENDFFPDGDLLREIEKDAPEVVFICNPNNPTGRLWDRGLLAEILDLCKRKGIRLFVDECFLELCGGGSMKDRLSEYPGLFILRAFTKTWGMAGLRLGYCLTSDRELLAKMSRLCPPWNISVPAQAAGVAALKDGAFLQNARELISKERPILKAGLEALGLYVCPSEANYLLFCAPEDLGGKLLKKGIALRDCRNFPGLAPGWYRAAVRNAGDNAELLSAVREAL